MGRLHFGALSPARRAPGVRLDLFLLHPIHSDLACQELGIGSGPTGVSNGGVLIKSLISRSTRKGQIGSRGSSGPLLVHYRSLLGSPGPLLGSPLASPGPSGPRNDGISMKVLISKGTRTGPWPSGPPNDGISIKVLISRGTRTGPWPSEPPNGGISIQVFISRGTRTGPWPSGPPNGGHFY